MPRPPNPRARTKLLVAGLQLFRLHGVKATGVKEIAERAEVPKGSFYSYYSSKDEFVVGVLEYCWTELEHEVGPLLRTKQPPLERLTTYFRALADDYERHAYLLGGLLGNVGLELAASSTVVADRMRTIMTMWEKRLAAVFTHDDESKRREVAALIIEAWEGAVFRAKIDGSDKPYARFEAVTLPLLTDLCEGET
ncbi:Transcriptional regulator AcuR [Mycobacterium basiliense]|uniref:Transcriptional regulator AcuR n=1 Tax=Mycobacterium basiliense TaxID=2094119 RepID=A0A447GKU5_9MYCO|nr:TetR/AcrR family transcriptional regulator [Mycobacterium basiliense]VDM91049.1 Transcriptional regulator AcuR [Mycobacterium basiliense]